MAGDGECTFFPERVLGIDLTDACQRHDNSALDLDAHVELFLDVIAAFGTDPLGLIVGGIMFCGTTGWWLVRYRVWGKRRGRRLPLSKKLR